MKITKDQLKQIIKEEMEDSLVDEGALDYMKGIATKAIGAAGLGGKASSKGQQEVTKFFEKQFLDLVKATPEPGSDKFDKFGMQGAALDAEYGDTLTRAQKNTIIGAERIAAYVGHNDKRKLLTQMRAKMGAYIYEMGLARKKKIDPNFEKDGIRNKLTINNAEDMRRAITILQYGYLAFNKTKEKFANKTVMFSRVLAPDNLFKKVKVDIQSQLKDFYQKRVSGRTIGQARHDTVLGIGAYLAELRNEVIAKEALFNRVLQAAIPKRQLNKALEESKMKITKTQLKQIIKEELNSGREAIDKVREVVVLWDSLYKSLADNESKELFERYLNKALEESKMKITKTRLKQIIKQELNSGREAIDKVIEVVALRDSLYKSLADNESKELFERYLNKNLVIYTERWREDRKDTGGYEAESEEIGSLQETGGGEEFSDEVKARLRLAKHFLGAFQWVLPVTDAEDTALKSIYKDIIDQLKYEVEPYMGKTKNENHKGG